MLDLKYAHIFDVSVARLTVGSPTNRANNGEHRYGFCKPPADFLAAFSLRSVSSPAASIGTYAEISRWYRSLSCSAIFSYPVRVSGSMLFHCSPSILAMSANFMSGCAALIFGRAICTKHMYAPFGPLGLFGSTTSLPLPRPFFLPSLPLSFLDFFEAFSNVPSGLRLLRDRVRRRRDGGFSSGNETSLPVRQVADDGFDEPLDSARACFCSRTRDRGLLNRGGVREAARARRGAGRRKPTPRGDAPGDPLAGAGLEELLDL